MIKKIPPYKRFPLILFLMMMLPCSLSAATQTWSGKISDSMCGATHQMTKEHEKKGEVSKTGTKGEKDRECTLACIKNGASYVLVSKGKVFQIANQDFAGLEKHAGHSVKLTGEVAADGKTITVSEITAPGKMGKTDSSGAKKHNNKS